MRKFSLRGSAWPPRSFVGRCREPERSTEPRDASNRFAGLYRQHAAFVHSLIRREGVAGPAVDDLVQEVFLVVHRRVDEFHGRAAFRAWLARITENVVRNHRRARRRRAKNEALWVTGGEPTEPADPADDPLTCVCRHELREAVRRAVSSLGGSTTRVLVLAELEELSPAQIASTTTTALHTVYTRRRAARRLFEKAFRRQARIHGWEEPGAGGLHW